MATKHTRVNNRSSIKAFAGIPKECMKHENYCLLSPNAKVLLVEFCYQYNGYNNGDLSAAFSVLQKRGWRSKGTVSRALKELRKAGWIILTRQGGKNQCSLYAITFKAIDECSGKHELKPTNIAPGDWKKIKSLPPMSTNEVSQRGSQV